jgi:hypothetical protein
MKGPSGVNALLGQLHVVIGFGQHLMVNVLGVSAGFRDSAAAVVRNGRLAGGHPAFAQFASLFASAVLDEH